MAPFERSYDEKMSFKNVTMFTKMLHVYISVTVIDRPIVTIIHGYELIHSLSFRTMTYNLRYHDGHKWSYEFTKNVFSQSDFELEISYKD